MVTTVASGDKALQAMRTVQSDVLVSDIGLSGMDGYQLMRRVRAGETAQRGIPALALTAFARAEDRRRPCLPAIRRISQSRSTSQSRC
jgi:CheY-like chemotaxis protein